ncbi:chloride channel protein [Actinocatenispora thailandica]|uniref:chloride channel protein n=1 Tax=Actinocatenispora thailandica TaxID=227318 RepID=UPI00194FCDDB|nr:chloride channel protein [Actinocatenispora thailandica]
MDGATGSAAGHEARTGAGVLRLVLLGAAIGVPAAFAAAGFLALVHFLETWLWTDLPSALGHRTPPWYLVVGLPVAGALIVLAVRRLLPGDGGHRPLQGIGGGPTPLAAGPGVVLAALGTLPFGAVLGPEAPIVAIGSVLGVAASRLAHLDARRTQVLSTAGSFSAISALFGGPVVAGMLLLEAGLAAGSALLPALVPGVVAAAIGYVIFIGFGTWGGLNAPGLTVPHLPAYQGLHLYDLLIAIAVGILAALLLAGVHRVASRVERLQQRFGMAPVLVGGGLLVGLLALAATGLGADSTNVLFSGQTSLPALVGAGSVGALLVLLVGKALAYAVSLGCGFRGGPIFPAIFLGVALAAVATVGFGVSPTLAIAVGTAAGMAAQARLLFSPLVFAALLVGHAGTDAVPAVALASATAWLAAQALTGRKHT